MSLPIAPPRPLSPSSVAVRSHLAFWGTVGAWLVWALLVLGNLIDHLFELWGGIFNAAGVICFLAALAMWVVMVLELLREPPSEYRWVWRWLLLSGPFLGGMLFYYQIWRKRYGRSAAA